MADKTPKTSLRFRVLNALAEAGLHPRSSYLLARELGVSKGRVLRALRELERAGWAHDVDGQWEMGAMIYRVMRKREEDLGNG